MYTYIYIYISRKANIFCAVRRPMVVELAFVVTSSVHKKEKKNHNRVSTREEKQR